MKKILWMTMLILGLNIPQASAFTEPFMFRKDANIIEFTRNLIVRDLRAKLEYQGKKRIIPELSVNKSQTGSLDVDQKKDI